MSKIVKYTAKDGRELTVTFDVKTVCDVIGNDIRNVVGNLIASMEIQRRGMTIQGAGENPEACELMVGEEYDRFEADVLMMLYKGTAISPSEDA